MESIRLHFPKGKNSSVSLTWMISSPKKTRPSFFPTNVPSVFIHFYIYSSFTGFFTYITFQKSRVLFLLDFPNGNGVGGRNFAIHLLPAATYLFEMTRVSIYA
jgi:hypothetical protein